jgi:hypothetical protein
MWVSIHSCIPVDIKDRLELCCQHQGLCPLLKKPEIPLWLFIAAEDLQAKQKKNSSTEDNYF